jgi:predicted SnoaL-like aldol condensation-catalyzing enzyme
VWLRRSILEAGHLELADKYLTDSYIQHNLSVPTGKKGLVDFFSLFAKPQPIADVIKGPLVAIIAEGDYVTLSFVRELTDPNETLSKNIRLHGLICSVWRPMRRAVAKLPNIGTLLK